MNKLEKYNKFCAVVELTGTLLNVTHVSASRRSSYAVLIPALDKELWDWLRSRDNKNYKNIHLVTDGIRFSYEIFNSTYSTLGDVLDKMNICEDINIVSGLKPISEEGFKFEYTELYVDKQQEKKEVNVESKEQVIITIGNQSRTFSNPNKNIDGALETITQLSEIMKEAQDKKSALSKSLNREIANVFVQTHAKKMRDIEDTIKLLEKITVAE